MEATRARTKEERAILRHTQGGMMTNTKTELALQKIDEIAALLQGSDNPLDQLILMAALTVKGSVFSYDTAILLREALKEVNEQEIKLLEAQQQEYIKGEDVFPWTERAYEMLKESGWQPPTDPSQL